MFEMSQLRDDREAGLLRRQNQISYIFHETPAGHRSSFIQETNGVNKTFCGIPRFMEVTYPEFGSHLGEPPSRPATGWTFSRCVFSANDLPADTLPEGCS